MVKDSADTPAKSALECLTSMTPSSASTGIERNLPNSVNKRGWAGGRETEKETDRCTQADTQTDRHTDAERQGERDTGSDNI